MYECKTKSCREDNFSLSNTAGGHDRREVCVFGEVKNEEKWNFGHISKISKPISLKFFKAMAITIILMKS